MGLGRTALAPGLLCAVLVACSEDQESSQDQNAVDIPPASTISEATAPAGAPSVTNDPDTNPTTGVTAPMPTAAPSTTEENATGAGGNPSQSAGSGGTPGLDPDAFDPSTAGSGGAGGLAPTDVSGPSAGGGPGQDPTLGAGGAPGEGPADEVDATASFDIEFDTRFDTAGWYDEGKLAVLREAARTWERFIGDDFEAIPAGTNLRARQPEQMLGDAIYLQLEYEIDDLVVLLGSDGAYDGFERLARTGVSATTQDVPAELAPILIERYEGHPAQPWVATLTFDPTWDWFVDPTPEDASDLPAEQVDFLSVALHELGHALGLGTLDAFETLIVDGQFVGEKAVEVFGGPVPMTEDEHIAKDVTVDGVYPIMESGTAPGQRKGITALDLAMLEDIGYTVRWEELE